MQGLENKILDIIQKIEGLAPSATTLVLKAVQVECFSVILMAAVGLVVSSASAVYGYKMDKKVDGWEHDGQWIKAALMCAFGFVGTVGALSYFANAWYWTGMFYPELYLAHLLLPT